MKFHFVNPFNGHFCELGQPRFAQKKMEFPSQDVSKAYSILFSAKFKPFSNPFRGRARQGKCTINVRNDALHDLACAVKSENPPNEGGNFVSLNMEKGYQFWE